MILRDLHCGSEVCQPCGCQPSSVLREPIRRQVHLFLPTVIESRGNGLHRRTERSCIGKDWNRRSVGVRKVCATDPYRTDPNCTNLATPSDLSCRKCWSGRTCRNPASHSKSAGLRPLGVRLPLPAPQIVKKLSEFLQKQNAPLRVHVCAKCAHRSK